MSEQRIPPRPVEDWDDEVREAFTAVTAGSTPPGQAGSPPQSAPNVDDNVREALTTPKPGRVPPGQADPSPRSAPNIIAVYAWHPELTRGWMPFSNHLRNSTLPDRVRELVVLRVAWLRHGEYQWSQHTRLGRKAGLSDGEIGHPLQRAGERLGASRGGSASRGRRDVRGPEYLRRHLAGAGGTARPQAATGPRLYDRDLRHALPGLQHHRPAAGPRDAGFRFRVGGHAVGPGLTSAPPPGTGQGGGAGGLTRGRAAPA